MLFQPIVLQYDEDLHARAEAFTYKKLRAIIAAALFVIQTILRKRQEFRIFRQSPESEKTHTRTIVLWEDRSVDEIYIYIYIYI